LTDKQKAGLRRLFASSESAYFVAGAADGVASVAGTAEAATASIAGAAEAGASVAGAAATGAAAGAAVSAAFSPQADKDRANRTAIKAERFIFFPI